MLPSYFEYIFEHLRQKVRLRSELSPKFLSTLSPHPTQKARPDLQLRDEKKRKTQTRMSRIQATRSPNLLLLIEIEQNAAAVFQP